MLVKKQEKNGKIKAMYSSSTICGSVYDTATNELIVIFNNGGQYKYPNVDLTDYTRFEIAESNGSVFNSTIKKKYTTFTKLESLTESALQTVLNEVKTLKEAEDKSLIDGRTKSMLNSMLSVINKHINYNAINKTDLDLVKTEIDKYLEITINPE